jgi:tetratricopeptide (TPR) repeat protein
MNGLIFLITMSLSLFVASTLNTFYPVSAINREELLQELLSELIKITAEKVHDQSLEMKVGQDILSYTNTSNTKAQCSSAGINDEFINFFANSTEINQNDANALYNKGLALLCLGRYEESANSFTRSIEIDPNHADAWNNKGLDVLLLGRYNDSNGYFDKALQIDPSYAPAWSNKGFSLILSGKYNEANGYFDKALQIDPSYDPAMAGKDLINAIRNSRR